MKKLFIFLAAVAVLAAVSCKKDKVEPGEGNATYYTITVTANNSEFGAVTGGGSYAKGSSVSIAAIAAEGCRFTGWQDGNTDNPRTIQVTGNATYVANFEREPTYADAFVGEYTVEGTANFTNVPMIGTYSMDFPAMDATIVKIGNSNEVEMTMYGETQSGYVNSDGLHIDPIVINQEIMGTAVAITVTFPIISAPVNGVMTWTSNLSASFSGMAITGTADLTATAK